MAKYIRGVDRDQPMLLPTTVDDYIGEGSSLRALDVFVDSLDLADLGFGVRSSDSKGRSGYDPAVLNQALPLGLPQSQSFESEP